MFRILIHRFTKVSCRGNRDLLFLASVIYNKPQRWKLVNFNLEARDALNTPEKLTAAKIKLVDDLIAHSLEVVLLENDFWGARVENRGYFYLFVVIFSERKCSHVERPEITKGRREPARLVTYREDSLKLVEVHADVEGR